MRNWIQRMFCCHYWARGFARNRYECIRLRDPVFLWVCTRCGKVVFKDLGWLPIQEG